VGVVQANIDQARKWDAAYRRETMNRYVRLTRQVAQDSDVVIWPEAATPFFFELEPDYRTQVSALTRSHQVPLLLGSPTLRRFPDGRPYLLNSAYLLDPGGNIVGRYDKRHLVPFGEYIPLRSLLFFVEKLAEGIGDFEPGTGQTVLSLPDQEAGRSGAPAPRFGVVICYEVIYPDLVRQIVGHGADFMVTITNDAWFGESTAPFQHFGMVVLRAVENRVAFARAANTGISGFIDARGRILHATPIFEEASFTGHISALRSPTLYTEYGDVFSYACVIISAILLLTAEINRSGRAQRKRY
ncbi:MAG: apolipoprotein N-acyltransferase, partial [Nitrospiraceae bacterium]